MPEFSNKNALDMKFNIMDKHSLPYDMILGKDALSDLKIKLDYEHETVKWDNVKVLMKSKSEVYDLQESQKLHSLCASACHEDEPKVSFLL